MTAAFVGLGSNLRDPRRQVEAAFAELDALPRSRLVKRSSLYRSAPVGHADQPEFVNAVAQLETGLPAEHLLAELQAIELKHGRERSFPNAPRTLDLDLLLFGESTFSSKTLTVPHPRMHERAFVLRPLIEIDSSLAIPGRGPVTEYIEKTKDQEAERIP